MKRRIEDSNYYHVQNHRSQGNANSNPISKYLSQLNVNVNNDFYFLDIGCRAAHTVGMFKDLGANSYGFDIGDNALAGWSNLNYRNNLKQHDAHFAFDYDFKFDLISISHALEHCHTPELVLKNIDDSLKDNGKVWCVVPIEDMNFDHTGHAHYTIFTNHKEHVEMFDNNGFVVIWDECDGNESRLIAVKK